MADLGEQIDGLNGAKVKAEKDKAGLERDRPTQFKSVPGILGGEEMCLPL